MAKPHKYSRATKEDKSKVETLAGLGIPADQIALVMECGETTVKKYFAEELKTGVAKASARVAQWAFSAAAKGNVSMIIFLCKTRLGWRETSNIEHSGGVTIVIED